MDYAGKYLKEYEGKRYTFLERSLFITVPLDSEDFGDLSFYQAGTRWDIYKQHARAAILRIGQGSWKDPEFETNYRNARINEVVLGGYFFYDGRYSPNQQAAVVVQALQGKHLEMELFVDWEHNYNGSFEGLRYVVTFMRLLEAAGLQVKAIGMYTGYYFFIENTLEDQDFYAYLEDKPLWLAWYASPILVRIPRPWVKWTHWQYGTIDEYWGQPTRELDRNKFNGSKNEFAVIYVGETMQVQGTVNASAGLNVRSAPSSTATILGALPNGTPIRGELSNGWISGTFNGLTGYILALYVNWTAIVNADNVVIELSYQENVLSSVTVDGVVWVSPS